MPSSTDNTWEQLKQFLKDNPSAKVSLNATPGELGLTHEPIMVNTFAQAENMFAVTDPISLLTTGDPLEYLMDKYDKTYQSILQASIRNYDFINTKLIPWCSEPVIKDTISQKELNKTYDLQDYNSPQPIYELMKGLTDEQLKRCFRIHRGSNPSRFRSISSLNQSRRTSHDIRKNKHHRRR